VDPHLFLYKKKKEKTLTRIDCKQMDGKDKEAKEVVFLLPFLFRLIPSGADDSILVPRTSLSLSLLSFHMT
jgi:hypothetical protein